MKARFALPGRRSAIALSSRREARPGEHQRGTRLLQGLFDDVLAEKPLPGCRKALMMAKVLGAEELREWAKKELYGYESQELPAYRLRPVEE